MNQPSTHIALERLQQVIAQGLPDATIKVSDMTGTGDHLAVDVMAPQFAGKSLMAQHRMVMDLLKKEFEQGLHAIKISTRIPTESNHE